MLFGFFRNIKKKAVICLGLLALALILKITFPETGALAGRWISGCEDSRIAQAFSHLFTSLSDGEKINDAVEVFCETIQNPAEN